MNKWCALNFDIRFYVTTTSACAVSQLHALLLLALSSDKGKN